MTASIEVVGNSTVVHRSEVITIVDLLYVGLAFVCTLEHSSDDFAPAKWFSWQLLDFLTRFSPKPQ